MTSPAASIVGVLLLLLFPLALLADNDVEQLIQQAGVKEGPVAVRDIPGWETPDKILVRELAPGLVDGLQQVLSLAARFLVQCRYLILQNIGQLSHQLVRQLGEVVDEVQWVLDLVCDKGGELAEVGHLLRLD